VHLSCTCGHNVGEMTAKSCCEAVYTFYLYCYSFDRIKPKFVWLLGCIALSHPKQGIAHTSLGTIGAKALCANMSWPTSRLPGMPPVRPVTPTEDGGKKYCSTAGRSSACQWRNLHSCCPAFGPLHQSLHTKRGMFSGDHADPRGSAPGDAETLLLPELG